ATPAAYPVNALLAATHDQPADASSLPSQLLTIEVLQRPLDFALNRPITACE
ncbi:MAG: hypothetical protein H0T94_09605, partial [Acidimicrobiia bacterium]|nr:hypothetical protein [Acidimicrobiia bacterium]